MNPDRRCAVQSVAAHSLYEASDPWRLHEPGGVVELAETNFTQETNRNVRVFGSRFVPDPIYRVKLEGAEQVGYRTICIAGVRDPSVINHLDEMLNNARTRTAEQFNDLDPKSWELHFRVYGRNGVMGVLETDMTIPHEVGILIEAVAKEEMNASSICMFVHALLLHYGFPGRKSTAGNLAFPFSPQDIPAGPVYRFNIYHLMEVNDPLAHFPIQIVEI